MISRNNVCTAVPYQVLLYVKHIFFLGYFTFLVRPAAFSRTLSRRKYKPRLRVEVGALGLRGMRTIASISGESY